MKRVWQALLIVLLAFLGFVAGGMAGAGVAPADSGLAGGATVFLWAVGGTVVAIAIGAVLVSRVSMRAQRATILTAAALAVLALLWMAR